MYNALLSCGKKFKQTDKKEKKIFLIIENSEG
jgi:hypothetical protein